MRCPSHAECYPSFSFFFFNDTATTEIYTFPYTTLFRSLNPYPPAICAACSRTPHPAAPLKRDRKSTRLNSSHMSISYAVFCLKKKIVQNHSTLRTEASSVADVSCSHVNTHISER